MLFGEGKRSEHNIENINRLLLLLVVVLALVLVIAPPQQVVKCDGHGVGDSPPSPPPQPFPASSADDVATMRESGEGGGPRGHAV